MTDHPEHAIRCPWCRAAPGNRCTSPRGRRLAIASHDARKDAWTARQSQDQQAGDTE
jgi:hypothetical protein